MSTTLSNRSRPSTERQGAGLCEAPLISLAASAYSVSLIRVDLPEPDTPVIAVNRPAGIDRSTFFRLLPLAPLMRSVNLGRSEARRVGKDSAVIVRPC